MQNYHVKLQSEVATGYRCQRAADSLDIDVSKKSVHELQITADLETDYSVGLIVGASGSGKTTLTKQIFGQDCFQVNVDPSKTIIDQLPKELSYDQCAEILSGIGLTSVPCWIRPVATLSNGQRARAEAALAMVTQSSGVSVVDEWTSVVDRTVAKVMSHCAQKFARRNGKKIVLVSCHYDVIEWLNPDWIIDCNKATYTDRRLLPASQRARAEQLDFSVREIDTKSWKYFSKYHYLSDRLPGGKLYNFGLFNGDNQIGYLCYANYVPTRKGDVGIYHFNRLVVHPDYAGMGLGIRFVNATAPIMAARGFRVMGKFSSTPVFKALSRDKTWRLKEIKRMIGNTTVTGNIGRQTGFRQNIKTYSFEYVGS